MPDANYVKVEPGADGRGLMLRCLYGGSEVGQFKWEDVAGYTIDTPGGPINRGAYEAWGLRPSPSFQE